MSTLSDGAALYRRRHNRPEPPGTTTEDTPPTDLERGRMLHQARRGDQAARDALRSWSLQTGEEGTGVTPGGDAA